MTEGATPEPSGSLAAELQTAMTTPKWQVNSRERRLQFGCVWFGSRKNIAEGKPHPWVIVSHQIGHVPPNLLLCFSSSKPKSGRCVLRLPVGAIRRKMRGKYVKSYVKCKRKFQIPTSDVENMEYLHALEAVHLELLKQCLRLGEASQ